MKKNTVISMAQFKAERRATTAKETDQTTPGKSLPDASRLWELLDKNISLSVWLKAH